MKRKFLAFVLLITAGLSLSSCLSSDDDTNIEYSHDTAITSRDRFTLLRGVADSGKISTLKELTRGLKGNPLLLAPTIRLR
mgnify:CR=1 FL=1